MSNDKPKKSQCVRNFYVEDEWLREYGTRCVHEYAYVFVCNVISERNSNRKKDLCISPLVDAHDRFVNVVRSMRFCPASSCIFTPKLNG